MKHMARIYLDNNASTFVDPHVVDVIAETLKSFPGNPSSTHVFGRESRQLLIKSREVIASYLKVRPKEIIFTSGGTEGANMLIRGLLEGNARKGHIITSNLEHPCVLNSVERLMEEGYEATLLSPGLKGAVSPQEVQAAIQPNTVLIALMAVNNETGVKTDIPTIAQIAEQAKIPFFVDGVALFGKEPFQIPFGVSGMSFSGHKFHAPKGSGFVYLKANQKFSPLLVGGEQEYNKRGGTENLADIAGMAEAVRRLESVLPEASRQMLELRTYFETTLQKLLGSKVSINGEGERINNTVNLAFSGIDGESLLLALDIKGIAVSHGSACSSGAMEPSRILLNMGIPLERAKQSLRFSLSRFTTKAEIDHTIQALLELTQNSI